MPYSTTGTNAQATSEIGDASSGARFKLFYQRRHTARTLVTKDAFKPPHRKEKIGYSHEGFVVGDCSRPVLKRIDVEPAQEYASRVYFVEDAPTFFARCMKNNDDRVALP